MFILLDACMTLFIVAKCALFGSYHIITIKYKVKHLD
jgi:hypothetical protein